MSLQIGSVIRDWEIIRLIGEGGMSEVYLVKDNLNRQFAMKVLSANLHRDSSFRGRFKQEATIMASLHHPNIVQLHSYFELDDLYCLVMEYIEGGSLKDLIRQTGPIPEERALRIFQQIAEALAYAHGKGIIHRDIKPSNILIDKDDNIKVMDFGIARMVETEGMTKTGSRMGTLVYMSPEQIKDSKHIDSKTDVYSLGVTLYEMLTGQSPYDETTESDYDIRVNIVNEDIPDPTVAYPHISESTVQMLKALTQKEKQNRPEADQILLRIDEPGNQDEPILQSIHTGTTQSYIYVNKEEFHDHKITELSDSNTQKALSVEKTSTSILLRMSIGIMAVIGLILGLYLCEQSSPQPEEIPVEYDVLETPALPHPEKTGDENHLVNNREDNVFPKIAYGYWDTVTPNFTYDEENGLTDWLRGIEINVNQDGDIWFQYGSLIGGKITATRGNGQSYIFDVITEDNVSTYIEFNFINQNKMKIRAPYMIRWQPDIFKEYKRYNRN